MNTPRSRRVAAGVLALSLGLAACIDGPLARLSPYDPDSTLELTIVGGSDTLRVAFEAVVFQLVTKPQIYGHLVEWSSSLESQLVPRGNGIFELGGLPLAPRDIMISARIGVQSATRVVTVVPEGWP